MDWGLGLRALTAKGVDSIPGPGARIPQAMKRRQKQKKKKEWNALFHLHLLFL